MGEWGGGGCGVLSLGISMEEKVGMADCLGWPSFPREPVVGGVRQAVCLATPAAAWVGRH